MSLLPDIEVIFVRHAQSQANLLWDETGSDPYIFDPVLTEKGYQQAENFKNNIKYFIPDLIVSSPLKRALLTAEFIFAGIECKWLVHPLVTEQMSESDDIGSLKNELSVEFPCWDWSLVCDDFWWYVPEEYKSCSQSLDDHKSLFISTNWNESAEILDNRINKFLDWLQNRPESKIIVFTHGDYIDRIIGEDVDTANCGFISRTYSRQKPTN